MGEYCMGPMDANCPDGIAPTCIESDIVVDTQEDESDGGMLNTDPIIAASGTGTSLREALILATNLPGPHHISFDLEPNEFNAPASNLPAVPDLTFIDGADPIVKKTRMRPTQASRAQDGLTIEGSNVIVGNMHIAGFPRNAIKINTGATDVNMFNVSMGEADYPNQVGLKILSGTKNITLGRGRELPCIKPIVLAHGANNSSYDVNLVLSNEHNGILAEGTSNLRIYGTWVGFTNNASLCDGDSCGNGWVGIHLIDVQDAVIGMQQLDAEYQALDKKQSVSIGPSFVAVGRSGAGGVLIEGGGDISMPGLLIGDTPNMAPFAQNNNWGLEISGNTGPVSYGGNMGATGRDAVAFGLIYTKEVRPITIYSNQGPVEIFKTQIIAPSDEQPDVALLASNSQAAIYLKHMSITLNPARAAMQFDGDQIDTQVVNCLFRTYSYQDVPVFSGNGLTYEGISIHNNMQYGYREWSERNYPLSSENLSSSIDPLSADCALDAIPIQVDCPPIDMAEDLGVDMNGEQEGLFNGCGPEIGAFECTTEDCLNAGCD